MWYDNPFIAIQEVTRIKNFKSYLGRSVRTKFSKRVFEHIQHSLTQQLKHKFFIRLRNQTTHTEFSYYSTFDKPQPYYFSYSVITCLEHQLVADLEKIRPELEFSDISYFTSCIFRPAEWANLACLLDFCISILRIRGRFPIVRPVEGNQNLYDDAEQGIAFEFARSATAESLCIAIMVHPKARGTFGRHSAS